ncbi:rho GTPase-activating protein 7 isoform X1 [Esox lucius]|uniref:rho GTPase-activating protein 7 isoform X1 n=1 Tax=Esox lucius TaxID=8010 RepID=UPI0014774C9A|nr:rho GTPase-activating protein 7 isoform X1 [Esox lucius]XP_010886789.2 rho GTPase-activating protein 7 isoform X1 [Esox lucius]XP_019899443.2 rho GTPase-activating protein 7 isoform X1 [Esox lucius]
MPVAIRKRRWEDHVTHRSGLKYSFDDLDLVCCHVVSIDRPRSRVASGGSKQGRRVRCASMPECCHQPCPDGLSDDPGRTFGTSVNAKDSGDLSEPGHVVTEGDCDSAVVPVFEAGLEDGSGGAFVDDDLTGGQKESEPAQMTDAGEDAVGSQSLSDLSDGILKPNPNISCTADSGHENGNTDNEHPDAVDDCGRVVVQSPSVDKGQRAYSDNGHFNVGELTGRCPELQETMADCTDQHGGPPEHSEETQRGSARSELESKGDLFTSDESNVTDQSERNDEIHLERVLDCTNKSENERDEISDVIAEILEAPVTEVVEAEGMEVGYVEDDALASKAAESVKDIDRLSVQIKDDEIGYESDQILRGRCSVSADSSCTEQKQNEICRNDETPSCERALDQTELRKDDVEMEMEGNRGEKRAIGSNYEKAPEDNSSVPFVMDTCVTVQHSEELENNPLAGQQNLENSKVCKIEELPTREDVNILARHVHGDDQTMENISGALVSEDLASSEDETSAVTSKVQGLYSDSSSKLDTIHEINHSESETADPKIETLSQSLCPEKANDPMPERCHSNLLAPVSTLCESPVLAATDSHKEQDRPGDKEGTMELTEEVAEPGDCRNPPLGNKVFDVKVTSQDDKEEDHVVRLRTRKSSREERERSRLDSMVLLLMKLDQLDQEIETALSSSSSMASTPTLKRHDCLEVDGSVTTTGTGSGASLSVTPSQQHEAQTTSPGPTAATGTKPKTGSLPTVPGTNQKEIEAKEASAWLRAAGFPQYAQLYEDGLFPIEIESVTRDHDFLDRDAIEALCRRLNTLNKCALMKLDISPQRKRSEDSDEDEPCAISGRWTFQRDSKRWSRLEELDVFSLPGADQPPFPQDQRPAAGQGKLREGLSSESVLTDVSEQPEVTSLHSGGSDVGRGVAGNADGAKPRDATAGATRASSVASVCSSSGTGGSCGINEDSLSDGPPPSPLETALRRFTFEGKSGRTAGTGGTEMRTREAGGGKSTRSRAKSFLKRMESLRLRSTSSSRKKKGVAGIARLEISGPVIKEGLDDDKLRRLNCVDISSLDPTLTATLNRNRSVSYSTQTSSGSTGSTGSSQSEASSGSAVSTPSPVTRARSHSTAAGSGKRGGMYLEGYDPLSEFLQPPQKPPGSARPKRAQQPPQQQPGNQTVAEQNCQNRGGLSKRGRLNGEMEDEDEEQGVIFFYLPEGHKPGTFPKALGDGKLPPQTRNSQSVSLPTGERQCGSRRQTRRSSTGSAESRLSFYDNVPATAYYCEEEDEQYGEGEEPKLEEVLEQVSGMQRFVNNWTDGVPVGEEEDEEEEEEEEEGDSDSALDSASPCPSSPLQNRLEETENGSDQDSTGNPLREGEGEGEEGRRERRDSGVGASLTRSNRPQKLRWPSFQASHRPSHSWARLQIGCQSVLQMNLLQKLSLLQLTALLEKHTPTNKHGFSWAVPKFMKRIKARDYKDRNVFGVPLLLNVQRTGQPLPQSIQQAMRYLRSQCLDQVGLFRKSGVKSRIQALRQMNEACGADGGGVSYEGQSAYDVADMLKQYFRDLPEPLLTSKLTETFLQIYQYMPKELRLQASRAAVLLLPDENREALQTLLCLLSDVTAAVAENQMTCANLAVCLAPSLFHLNTLRRKESSSPRVMNRKQALGKPDQRDLNENLAATHGLAHMIQECRKLFRIPEEMSRCRNSYLEQALIPLKLEELGGSPRGDGGAGSPPGYRAYLRDSLDALLKEAKDKFKGYDSCSTPEHAELAYKKVHDGSPLRLWKASVEVPAGPEEVLTRVLREQGRWDEDLIESRVVEVLDERADVYQYVRNTMAPHPARDHLVLRSWATDLPKGACALVCTSVDRDGAPLLGVRANVLTSRYFIEPCGSNKSRLTHISRVDCRGRFPEWYHKLYGHLCATEVVRIRESFTAPMDK